MHGHPNYAMLKITTSTTVNQPATLTMEYKDRDDPYGRYRSDLTPGYGEGAMRIYRWRDDLLQWEQIPLISSPTVDTTNNTVSMDIANLGLAQIYAVKADIAIPVELSRFEAEAMIPKD